ncbi:hypothetical protein [Thermoactinospora rubra]|uniref:hypothetical protein n=1 Tax=Thermoactinospora rubra TaxID=1088767 RepID=UPI000A116584|nr:hypothetical protein [Thermoactinospora rubra]
MALAASAAVACGPTPDPSAGFNGASRQRSPEPASPAASAPATPTPSATSSPPAKPVARYPFPKDFKVVFPSYSGEGQAAVQTFRDFWGAWWYAVTTHGRDRRYQDYLSTQDILGGGLTVFPEVVVDWRQQGVRPTGVLRVHKLDITLAEDARLGFTACVDASRLGTRSVATGQERWTLGKRPTSRYQMRILMERSAGAWKVGAFLSDSTVKECR